MLSANSCSGIRLLTVAHSILLCIVYEDNVAYAFWLHTDFIIYTIPPHHVFFFALDWIVLNDLFIARCPSVCELSWSSIVLVGAIRKKKNRAVGWTHLSSVTRKLQVQCTIQVAF